MKRRIGMGACSVLAWIMGLLPAATAQSTNVLPFRPLKAEYSESLDVLVFVGTNPPRFYITDRTGAQVRTELDLPIPPLAMALSLDGRFAVVGHSAAVSYINVATGALIGVIPVSSEVREIVLGSGYAYVIGSGANRVIDLGQRMELTGVHGIGGVNPKIHPSGQWIHAARGGSPDDIVKHVLLGGLVSETYDSPYHGDFSVCRNLWHSRNGKRIYTACGDVYSSSAVREQDLLYTGTIAVEGRIADLAETRSGELIAVSVAKNFSSSPVFGDAPLLFTLPFYNPAGSIALPPFSQGGRSFQSHTARIFAGPGDRELIVLVQADQSSGFLNDFGVVILRPDPPAVEVTGDLRQPLYPGEAATFSGSALSELVVNAGGGGPVVGLGGVDVRLVPQGRPALPVALYYVSPNDLSFRVPGGAAPGGGEIIIDSFAGQIRRPVRIVASAPRRGQPLSHSPVDVEYSVALDALVSVSAEPNRLTVFDLGSQAEVGTVRLSLQPSSVSVSPTGLTAAVGHGGWISVVDLVGLTVLGELQIPTDVFDTIYAGNGWVYAIPRRDQWELLHAVHVASGQTVESTGRQIRAGSVGRLHPGGKAVYLANRGLSPSDIEKLDISMGRPVYLYDSPYHGDFAMCGDLWFSADGLRIITRCGNVFRASEVTGEDMFFNGKMEHARTVLYATHLPEANLLGIVDEQHSFSPNAATELQFYDHRFLAFRGRAGLPPMEFGFEKGEGAGRFLFGRQGKSNWALVTSRIAMGGDTPDTYVSLVTMDATIANGASFDTSAITPGSLVSLFGTLMASGIGSAVDFPLPEELAGARLIVTDSEGNRHTARLIYVSPGQINFLMPEGLSFGLASVAFVRADGGVSLATVNVQPVAPGIFTADATGSGAPAAFTQRIGSSGSVSTAFVFTRDMFGVSRPAAIDLSGAGDVYLVLFGTGIRNWEIGVTARIGGVEVPVTAAVPHGIFAGLDQVNIGPLPRTLAGRGLVEVLLTVDSRSTNIVTISIR